MAIHELTDPVDGTGHQAMRAVEGAPFGSARSPYLRVRQISVARYAWRGLVECVSRQCIDLVSHLD
jgi:hypothetical protein